jgi:hypothetical protein
MIGRFKRVHHQPMLNFLRQAQERIQQWMQSPEMPLGKAQIPWRSGAGLCF